MKNYELLIISSMIVVGLSISSAYAQDSSAVQNEPLTDTAKYALLYVYRYRNMEGSMQSYDIHVDDTKVGTIKNNSKFIVKLYKEGTTTFWAKTEQKRSINVNVKFGQEYFLKCALTFGILVGRPEINLVYPEQGKMDFETIKEKKQKKGKIM